MANIEELVRFRAKLLRELLDQAFSVFFPVVLVGEDIVSAVVNER